MKRFAGLIMVLALASGCASAEEALPADPTAPRAHHTEDGFRNLYVDDQSKKGLFTFLFDVRLKEDWPDEDNLIEDPPIAQKKPDLARINNPDKSEIQTTWIGHSTFLIQHNGINILTDPIFSDRASPVSFAGPLRYTKPALKLEDLPPIDAVIISHNHYDHMDEATIRSLGNTPKWFIPLKNVDLFKASGITNVAEMDWWDKRRFKTMDITFTPAQHWSGRGLFDRYKALWGSWAIRFTDTQANLWFGGDTGYNDVQFKQIGEKLGPFDLSLIPIGAYAPRWFMRYSHASPEEAVKIHQDIRSRNSIGMHWGTFVLTAEPATEPPAMLAKAAKAAGLKEGSFLSLPIGGMVSYEPTAVGYEQQNIAKN
ncbi:MAG: MBL fold metallo-hydrolase [Sneathiella sp.]